jgi:hypothetical protein
MTRSSPPLDAVTIEPARFGAVRRDGSPTPGCHGDFHAYYVRWTGCGVRMLLGYVPAPQPFSPSGTSTSSGGAR